MAGCCSVYTIRLCDVVSVRGASTSIDDEGLRIIDKPGVIHLDKYPVFDESHRKVINSLILDTYWNREIAYETVDVFIGQLRMLMQKIMPAYNKLYESAAIDIDPFLTTDIRSESTGSSDTTSTRDSQADSTSTQGANTRSVNYSLPSQQLKADGHYGESGVDGLSSSDTSSTASDESTARDVTASDAKSRTFGYAGSQAALIQEYRASIINIDEMIVDELEPLFLMLWGSPHTFTDQYNYHGEEY